MVATCKVNLTPFESFRFILFLLFLSLSLSLHQALFLLHCPSPCLLLGENILRYIRNIFCQVFCYLSLEQSQTTSSMPYRWLLIAVLAIILPMSTFALEPRFMAISAVLSILSLIRSSGSFRAWGCDFAMFSIFWSIASAKWIAFATCQHWTTSIARDKTIFS